MKQVRKRIGSLLITVCMVLTMLPTVAFAEEGVQDSGTSPDTSEITAFADLAEDIALQEVETGTTLEELILPSALTVTVTTGSAITGTVSGDDVATDSDAQETETQEETTVEVSDWTSNPSYDGDTAGSYTFTPTLDIPEGITVAEGVTSPQIVVTVKESASPMLHAAATTSPVPNLSAAQAVSGELKLSDAGYDLSQHHSGTGWEWDTTTSTLTIDDSFKESLISIECESTDIINLYYKGDVKMRNMERACIVCSGVLNVDGSGGTLTLESPSRALNSNYDLTISSGTIVAKNTESGYGVIKSVYGSITIKGDAQVTAESTGTSGNSNYAIGTQDSFNVTDNAQVTATIQGTGTAILSQYGDIIISSNANVVAESNATSNDMQCNGINNYNGGDIVISTTGTVTAKGTGKNSYGLCAGKEIKISSGTVDVEAGGGKLGVISGPLYIVGDARVTVAATEANSNVVNSGYTAEGINIAGGSLKVTAKGNGFALASVGKLFMSAGTVKLYNSDSDNFITGELKYTGGTLSVNDKDIKAFINIVENLQDMNLAEGNISGSLTVAAAATNNETLSYLWQSYDNDKQVFVDIPSVTSSTFPIPTNLPVGIYQYRCKISSENTVPAYSVTAVVRIEKPRTIIVNNGTGGGKYVPGTVINITANTAPQDQCFEKWEISPSEHIIALMDGSSITDASVKFNIMMKMGTTFTALYQSLGASHHAITVQNDGNGIAKADVNSATQGTLITLTPAPNRGYQFKGWQVDDQTEITISGNNFIMPAENVKIKATFEPLAGSQYTISFDANGGSVLTLSMQTETNGKLSSLPTPTRSGSYSFAGWYTKQSGGTVVSKDTVFTAKTSLYAHWNYTGGGSSGGSSSGGSSSSGTSTKITTTKENQPNQPITATASVTATAGTNGTASASISDKAVTDAISKAQTELKKQGKSANGISVGLNVAMPKGATTLTATLSQNGVKSLVSAGVKKLEINGSPVTMTFDQKALTEIQKQSSGNVNITIAPKAELSKMAKVIIGTRPVYNLTVGYSDNSTVSSFGDGVVTVGIPYTPAKGESIGGLYAVYVDEKGNATRVEGSAYDANSGCIIFTTTHFSMYGVGYTIPSLKFTDISSHWAKESIDYVVGRGLLSGTSETTFAPNTAMTRGMLVTALGRLEGVDVSSYTKSSFTDVKAGSAFKPYIEWAYKKGIIQGIGNNKFAPDRAITREEIAVIIANFTKATGYTLPVKSEATIYADDSSISSTYKTAVTAMQQAGIMMGGTGSKFNPKSNATRSEVSSMLYRYIQLNIDSNTAQH